MFYTQSHCSGKEKPEEQMVLTVPPATLSPLWACSSPCLACGQQGIPRDTPGQDLLVLFAGQIYPGEDGILKPHIVPLRGLCWFTACTRHVLIIWQLTHEYTSGWIEKKPFVSYRHIQNILTSMTQNFIYPCSIFRCLPTFDFTLFFLV